jgi:AcrR family transcriptional regulator
MDRQTIKDAALDLFKRVSFEKTSVSDIARACGIGKGTFYLYFESKNDIFSAIMEERILAVAKRYETFYANPYVTLDDKIHQYFDNLIDDYFLIKDLLFGSFEKVQGQMVKDVFFKYGKYYFQSVDQLYTIVVFNDKNLARDGLHERVEEWMELMLGRMLMFVMINDWNDREGLKKIIATLSIKIYYALVAA